MHAVVLRINQHKKFEVPSFINSKDRPMIGAKYKTTVHVTLTMLIKG